MSSVNTRALATQAIDAILTDGSSLSYCLPLYKNKCTNREDTAFLQALIFGVIRWYPRLAFIANQLLEKPLKQKDRDLEYLIAVGLYQLTDMRVPEHAALAETVEAARVLNKPWATGLVNAVLRSYQRKSENIKKLLQTNEVAFYAHPQWLIDSLKTDWPDQWENILTANNALPPLSLRVNTQKNSRETYLQTLESSGIIAELIPHTSSGIVLKTPVDITTLPGFEKGLFSVQDGAAQLAAGLLELMPNLRVLDACAAPGGKTTHILEIEPNLTELIAIDISPDRTRLISENLARLQLHATVKTANAEKPETWWDGLLFDRILCDAPCSATGVIRRHPDIKYLKTADDLTQLSVQQLSLLNTLWLLLKPGGILVYATCSVLAIENDKTVEKFLSTTKNAFLMPSLLECGFPKSVGHQILPGQNDMDGFYYARIGKKLT
jgi:16S rRNA (cytosine967-C5)-methyltransferase